MKSSRSRTTFALLLGVLALFVTWRAVAQTTGEAVSDPVVSGPSILGMRVGGPDAEMQKLIDGEAAAAREVSKLIAEYGRTEKEAGREKVKTALAAALAKQFDFQQKRRDLELSRLEAKLKKLRGLMKKR